MFQQKDTRYSIILYNMPNSILDGNNPKERCMENEEAKAVQELAKLGSRALDSTDHLGNFLSRVFGTLPEDVVGVVGGDWLRHIRIRNVAKLAQRTEEILRNRGILDQTEPMSPSVALPLLHAAQDETREQLREMWARMLANGMDPKRCDSIRQSVISAVKNFDPLDAIVLQKAVNKSSFNQDLVENRYLREVLGVTADELELSISNLTKLKCIHGWSGMGGHDKNENETASLQIVFLSPLGREVLRGCSL